MNVVKAVLDLDLEERGWWVVIMKLRASFVQKSITMEEHASEIREILIDDQELLLSVFLYQFFPSSSAKSTIKIM